MESWPQGGIGKQPHHGDTMVCKRVAHQSLTITEQHASGIQRDISSLRMLQQEIHTGTRWDSIKQAPRKTDHWAVQKKTACDMRCSDG